ncbi:MAG: YfiR family protein [Opitutaceae bacterium]|jgi:hypothetical protein
MTFRPFLPLLFVILASLPQASIAGDAKSETVIVKEAKVVKAAYIYNFAKFIDWTNEDGVDTSTTPIVICVVGDDPVGSELDEITSLQAKGRSISVLHIKSQDKIPHCHILYIGASEQPQVELLLQQVSNSEVLTVSDLPGFAERGGMIGFASKRGRVQIEINVPRARSVGLRINSKLLEIARIIPPLTTS